MKKLYNRVISLVLCLVFITGLSLDCFASTPLLPGAALPSVGVGVPLPAAYVNIDLNGFLSHVYDASRQTARYWGGALWNRLIDDTICPGAYAQDVNGHRHSFIYGLTSRDGVTGYFSYCEYCGQFAGDLVSEYQSANYDYIINSNNIFCPCFIGTPYVVYKLGSSSSASILTATFSFLRDNEVVHSYLASNTGTVNNNTPIFYENFFGSSSFSSSTYSVYNHNNLQNKY